MQTSQIWILTNRHMEGSHAGGRQRTALRAADHNVLVEQPIPNLLELQSVHDRAIALTNRDLVGILVIEKLQHLNGKPAKLAAFRIRVSGTKKFA